MARMPGGAAQTYGTAFTGRFAVNAGVNDPRSSSGTGNVRSTSNGASPRTRTRQPVGRRSHAGSTSVGAVPVRREAHDLGTAAASRRSSSAARRPCPAASSPGDAASSSRAPPRPRRRPSTRRPAGPRPRRAAPSDGLNSPRRYAARPGSNDSSGCPNPICSNSRCGESRRDRFGELVDLDRVDAALQRQQRERERVGDEPGAAPGRVDRRVAPRARVERRARRRSSPSRCPPPKSSPRVVTTFVPAFEQRDDVVEVEDARHVQHAVGAERVDRGADRRSRRRRPAPRRRARPRRRRPSRGRTPARPTSSSAGWRITSRNARVPMLPVAHWTTR